MNKIFKLITISLATIGLTACGQKKWSLQPRAEKRVQITYWHALTDSNKLALDLQIAGFNRSQGMFEVTGVSQGNEAVLQQKIAASKNSKELPTIAQIPYTKIGDYAKDGLLLPFDDLMSKGSTPLNELQLKDIYPSFLETGKFNGKQYGLPFSMSTRVMFINMAFMGELKLQPPKTWEDVSVIAPLLKDKNLSMIGLDQSYDVELEDLAQQTHSQLNTKDLKSNLTDPSVIKAANMLLDMSNNGGVLIAEKGSDFTDSFVNDKVIFGIGNSTSIPVIEQKLATLEGIETTAIPSYYSNNASVLSGDDNVMFKSASDAQRQGAWMFEKYLLKTDNTTQWAKNTGYVPVTKSGVYSKTYQDFLKTHPYYQATIDAIDNSFARTVFAGYSEYHSKLLDAVDKTLTKGIPVSRALGELDRETKEILKR